MLTPKGAIRWLRAHKQLPPSRTVILREIRPRFEISQKESIKSLIITLYKSVGPGWSMPNANTVILRRDVVAYGLDAFSAWT